MEALLNKMAFAGGGLVGAGIFASQFIFVVDGGERKLVMDSIRGLNKHIYQEGAHFKIPFIQKTIPFEIRTMPKLQPTTTISNDLQTVEIALRLLYRPDETALPMLLDKFGIDYDNRILPSISNEVLKSIVAQYNAEQLITQREKVSAEIREILQKRCAEFSIILDDVAITDM
jgi:prohibitin 1